MIAEIVVGTNKLSLPEPWRWQQNKNGSWSAVNSALEIGVSADVRGDDGLQVLVSSGRPTHVPTYVPLVVLAIVALANDGGMFNNILPKMSRYVTHVPEVEEIHDAD